MRLLFDIEGDNLLPDLTTIWCGVAIDVDTGEVWKFGPDRLLEFTELLFDAQVLIGHNILGYDLPALEAIMKFNSPIATKGLLDTLLLSKLLYPNLSEIDYAKVKSSLPPRLLGRHSLEAWGHRLGYPKLEFSDFSRYTPDMLEYCVQDAQLNVKLFKLLEERMAKFELPEAAIELEHTARQICLEQEWTGVCFNEIAARQLEQRLRARAEEIKTEVRDTFEPNIIQLKTKTKTVPFNLASRQQIADRLIARGWVPTDYTPSGQPRVDDDVLAGIKGIPEAALLAEYFMLQKRLGQLADGKQAWLNKVDDKGRIHGSVDTLGTGTFRCSHSDPNMAQVPSSAAPFGRECRELFFAPEGYDMVGVDVSKLELVVLAHYMNDRKFSEAVIDGDVHQLLADVYGTDRRTGKTITYAFLYGAGLKKIGSVIAPTGSEKQQIKEGQIIHANMKKRLPALAMLSAGVKNKAEKDGHIKLIDGRRCPVRSAHSALNFLCQGSGAIICKKWMCNVHRDARTHGFVLNRHWFQVLFVHDELQFYVQNKLSAGFGEFCVQSIARAGKELGLRLPLTGEYNVGASWADTH